MTTEFSWKAVGASVAVELLVVLALWIIHFIRFPTIYLWLAIVLPFLVVVIVPGVLWRRRGMWAGISAVFVGLVVLLLISSLVITRRPLALDEELVPLPNMDSLRTKLGVIHHSNVQDIALTGRAEAATGGTGAVQVLVGFLWTKKNDNLFGEHEYEGKVHLRAEWRVAPNRQGELGSFELVDYSAGPKRGEDAFLFGWFWIPMLMRQSSYFTDWADTQVSPLVRMAKQ